MERKNNISILRLIATLCVVAFHFLFFYLPAPCEFFPLSFGVQVLCVISGLLYSQKEITNVKKFYLDKFLKLVVPVVICVLFVMALNGITMLLLINRYTGDYWSTFWGVQAYMGDRHIQFGNLWFLPVFFLCYLLLPLFQKLAKNIKWWTPFALIGLTVLEISLSSPIVVTPFIWGYFIGKFRFTNLVDDCKIKRYSIPTLILASALVYVGYYFVYNCGNEKGCINLLGQLISGQFDGVALFNYIGKQFSQSVLGLSLSLLFLICTQRVNKTKKESRFLKFSDNFVYFVYIIEQSMLIGILSVWDLLTIKPIAVILILVFILAGAYIIYLLNGVTFKYLFKNYGKTKDQRDESKTN